MFDYSSLHGHYLPKSSLKTHSVKNQAKALTSLPLWEADTALREAFSLWAPKSQSMISTFAERVGSAEVVDWGWRANLTKPKLITHDRFGHRVDEVDFHPAYHQLMDLGISSGISGVAWSHLGISGGKRPQHGHLQHAAMLYLLSQVEAGVCCPLSMSYAATPVIAQAPGLREELELLISPKYDGRMLPMSQKTGITMGMAMTEKQGGSDVRANETVAFSTKESGVFALSGHKWFCSAPMSDAFLTLAKVEGELTCFFLPRWTPEGERNGISIMRLKDKMGNHSNASSEVEFDRAWAYQLGEVGAGVKTIIEMVHHTRLDASLANASIMRRAVTEAVSHCVHRSAFGKPLIDQALMRSVLADLWLESEAATWTTMYLAHSFDRASETQDESARGFTRLATALIKYWVCKRTPELVYEALECHGGAGYVEESIMPRLFRESPLNSIWEGSGNVICLDLLRAMRREPHSVSSLMNELNLSRGHHPLLDQKLSELENLLNKVRGMSGEEAARSARFIGAEMALTLQAALLTRCAPEILSKSFCESRLTQRGARVFGDLEPHVDLDKMFRLRSSALIDRVATEL